MAKIAPLNIGIYVTSLLPKGASQARLQASIFEGLERVTGDRYRFLVFTDDLPGQLPDIRNISFQKLNRESRWDCIRTAIKRRVAYILSRGFFLFGNSGNRCARTILVWANHEPKYYAQLRQLNVRLIWNMNPHELVTPLPYIRTIWEANHRILPMYPEYSYTRFTFDGYDAGMSYSLARASYVIVGTEEGKRQISTIFGVYGAKIRVLPFPTPIISVSGNCSRAINETICKGPYLFYPARFWPHKNHVTLLEAIKILRNKWNISLRCIFSGADEGNLTYVLDYARQIEVSDLIEYVGVISETDLKFVYRNAVALVYCSAVGPDNLPPLEAMSVGCPVITADVAGAREQYGNAALYFSAMSEQELARRVKELNENITLREQLISFGRTRANRWTAHDYVNGVVSILDEFSLFARCWARCDATFT